MGNSDSIKIEDRVVNVQSGRTQDYAYIVEEYQRPIFIYCYRLLGNDQEAEDAVQEILVKGYESIKRYTPKVNFSSWLYKIAYHHCLNLLRKRQLQLKIQRLFKPELTTEGPEQTLEKQVFSEPLALALHSISHHERSLLILHVFEEKTFAEIGEIIGKSAEAAKKKVGRIKQKVRERMKKGEENKAWREQTALMKTRI